MCIYLPAITWKLQVALNTHQTRMQFHPIFQRLNLASKQPERRVVVMHPVHPALRPFQDAKHRKEQRNSLEVLDWNHKHLSALWFIGLLFDLDKKESMSDG